MGLSREAVTRVRPAENCGVESLMHLGMTQGTSETSAFQINQITDSSWSRFIPVCMVGSCPNIDNCIIATTNKTDEDDIILLELVMESHGIVVSSGSR